MRINSMKLLTVMVLLSLISGIMTGLFFIEIPTGNREVAYLILGSLATMLVHSISNLFQKPAGG